MVDIREKDSSIIHCGTLGFWESNNNFEDCSISLFEGKINYHLAQYSFEELVKELMGRGYRVTLSKEIK